MNINKQINIYIQARLVFGIITNKLMLLFSHLLNQLTKLHYSFIKIFIVWSAVNNLSIAVCLIYNYAQ